MSAGDILKEAAEIVEGTRHGDKERSFGAVAGLWQAYLDNRPVQGFDGSLTAADVAHMMLLLKMARSLHGRPIRDHWVDMAGYAALAGELAEADGSAHDGG